MIAFVCAGPQGRREGQVQNQNGGLKMQQEFISTNEYVASEQLMASVNVAIALQKPLLIKGEPEQAKPCLPRR